MIVATERTALYRIRGEGDLLLYIGITNGVAHRWNGHMRVQPWWGELRSLTVEWFETRAEAEAAEEAAILAEQPKYNVTYLKPLRGRGRRAQREESESEPAEVPPLPDLTLEPRDDDEDLLDVLDVAKLTRLGQAGSVMHALKASGGPAGFRLGTIRLFRKGEIRRWVAQVEASQTPHPAAAVVAAEQAPKKKKVPKPPRAVADEGVLFDRDTVLQVIPSGAA